MTTTGNYLPERPIETLYYEDKGGHHIVKINRSKHRRKAIMNATDKLDNDYMGAWLAVIYDTTYGQLIRIIKRNLKTKKLEIMYEDDPSKPMCLSHIGENIADSDYRIVNFVFPKDEVPEFESV